MGKKYLYTGTDAPGPIIVEEADLDKEFPLSHFGFIEEGVEEGTVFISRFSCTEII